MMAQRNVTDRAHRYRAQKNVTVMAVFETWQWELGEHLIKLLGIAQMTLGLFCIQLALEPWAK